MTSPFLAYIYRLQYIQRWSLMRNTHPENVAEHSFHVAVLAHALCTIAETVYGKDVPRADVVTAALFHDAPEVLTGDIPTPVKHHNADILHHFRGIEQEAAAQLTAMVPPPLRPAYAPWLAEPPDAVRVWVKAADRLDAYLKCSFEVMAGNREFVVAKDQCAAALAAMNMPEVAYFLDTFAGAFEQTLDEISTAPPGGQASGRTDGTDGTVAPS